MVAFRGRNVTPASHFPYARRRRGGATRASIRKKRRLANARLQRRRIKAIANPGVARLPTEFDATRAAKRLLRLARFGALATMDGGAPLTTLVGVASDWDGSPLFLMSQLSRHTRNLSSDPRASLLLTSEGGRGDYLNQPRITLGGSISVHANLGAKLRYLRRNPKAKLYADFSDFSVRRLRIETIHFNGGFGRADAVGVADILSPAEGIDELVAAEEVLLREVDALGDATRARLVAGAVGGRRTWRAVGLDAEGLDLAAGVATARLDFSAPALEPESWREKLREALG
jgi:putative heme iron utilization protein